MQKIHAYLVLQDDGYLPDHTPFGLIGNKDTFYKSQGFLYLLHLQLRVLIPHLPDQRLQAYL